MFISLSCFLQDIHWTRDNVHTRYCDRGEGSYLIDKNIMIQVFQVLFGQNGNCTDSPDLIYNIFMVILTLIVTLI